MPDDSIETPGQRNTLTERQRGDLVVQLASALHDDWRNPRGVPFTGGEQFPIRENPTTDEEWVRRNRSRRPIVDIANTRYEDLPSDWQAENKASAEVAVRAITEATAKGEVLGYHFIQRNRDRLGDAVHEAWRTRNRRRLDKAKEKPLSDPAHQWALQTDIPFKNLLGEEQDKDIRIVWRGIDLYHKMVPPKPRFTTVRLAQEVDVAALEQMGIGDDRADKKTVIEFMRFIGQEPTIANVSREQNRIGNEFDSNWKQFVSTTRR